MVFGNDELEPGQADAVIRRERECKGLVGIADVHHDLGVWALDRRQIDVFDLEGQAAVVDEPGISLGARHGDDRPGGKGSRAGSRSRQSPEGPSSRLTMAAWQVRPPRLVTMAAAFFMIGSQSGSVLSVTRISPGLKKHEIGGVWDDANGAGGDSAAHASARHQDVTPLPQPVAFQPAGPARWSAPSPGAPAR